MSSQGQVYAQGVVRSGWGGGGGVAGNGEYYKRRMGEWSSSRFFVNMDMSTEASDTTTDLTENKKARTKIPFEDVRQGVYKLKIAIWK